MNMEINLLENNKEFKNVLFNNLDKIIRGEIEKIRIKNISPQMFCEMTGCKPNDFNGWQCDWWGGFEYKGRKFSVGGSAWCGFISIGLE